MIDTSWNKVLKDEFKKPYFIQLQANLQKEYHNYTIYPKKEDIFNAFKLSSFENTKVVILGQDPYHKVNQAHGLSFSVPKNIKIPPSLKNIFQELHNDIGITIPKSGDLSKWAKQGVLLINTSLSVRKAKANSHKKIGWERFTDKIIHILSEKKSNIVFILWGANAIKKLNLIDLKKHHTIQSPHPSPLSSYKGFFDSKPFSKCNEILLKSGLSKIQWSLDICLVPPT